MEVLNRLVSILPSLKTKIQLTGLVVIVGAVVAVKTIAPDLIAAQISAGSIGILFVIFGQAFQFLHLIPKGQRTIYILALFFGFLFFVMSLIVVTTYLLTTREPKPLKEIGFSIKDRDYVGKLNGKNCYVKVEEIPQYDFSDGITIEAWIKIDDFHNGFFPIIDKLWRLEVKKSSVTFSPGATAEVECPKSLNTNKWNHIAFSYNPHTQIAEYHVNGNLCNKVNYNEKLAIGNDFTKGWRYNTRDIDIYIGRGPTGGDEYSNGYFSEVRLWNIFKSGKEIVRDINKLLKDDQVGLVGCWSFNQTNSDLVFDSSVFKNHGKKYGNISWVNSSLTIPQ